MKSFDTVEANLVRAEALWKRIREEEPEGFQREASAAYRQMSREFHDLVTEGLPPIGGFRVEARPPDAGELGQRYFDASEIGEPEAFMSIADDQAAPGRELEEYRYRFTKKRRELVRRRITELISLMDAGLGRLNETFKSSEFGVSVKGPEWTQLTQCVSEIDRLVGSEGRSKSWGLLHRHLHFGEVSDLRNIHDSDWPDVKGSLANLVYEASEPLPVASTDLDAIVAAHPAGSVGTALNWDALNAETFERLIFDLISNTPGYVNPDWLMEVNAPDSGRDLSVIHVEKDPLRGERRNRVIIQCRHRKRSPADTDISAALTRISHWEPPKIDNLIFATTGRFTEGAVRWVDRHNEERRVPRIDLWAESHLEMLLAQRPHLAPIYGLR